MDSIGECPDVVLLAVKSYETADACRAILPYLTDHTSIVSLQNGLNEETIAAVVGQERTVGAICLFDAALLEPGHACQRRPGGKLVIGELTGNLTPRLHELASDLRVSMSVETTANIWGHLWSKLIRNVMINAVAAATGMGLGEMERNAVCRRFCVALGAEAIRVALAERIDLVTDDLYGHPPENYLDSPDSDSFRSVEESFARAYQSQPSHPSMLQDVLKGRRTEIEHINGYVVKRGRDLGIATPLNSEIVRLVQEIEAGRRTPDRGIVEERLAVLVRLSPRP
jgi:2-dehydropantoate 2-reductase